jgi:hypothetical protein
MGSRPPRYLWPRLAPTRAAELRIELAGLDPTAARGLAAVGDRRAAPVPSGGRPVPPERLAAVRDAVRAVAEEHGWPDAPARGGEGAFDRRAAVVLHREMAIVPADAAHDGVWHFLALVVLPDVVRWRRPDAEPSAPGGLLRHVLGRLWWRAQVFGDDVVDPSTAHPLSEAELAHLLGRPALVADHQVARAVASAVLAIDEPPAEREPRTEQLAERVLRRAPVVCFESLTPAQLTAEVARLAALDG